MNPNLVSLPVASISLAATREKPSTENVRYIDVGYEMFSFILNDGPNISIHYKDLARVSFTDNDNTAKVLVLCFINSWIFR